MWRGGPRTHSGAMNETVPLHRATNGRMVAGVAAGLATYLGVDVTIVRIGFAVATILGGGLGIPAYLICLLLIPEEGSDHSLATSFIHSIADGR
jgi:phage shock protein PspC (stress-responsive transcriptional regulator)